MKKQFITAQELAPVLDISVANAYLRIKEMNEEFAEVRSLTVPSDCYVLGWVIKTLRGRNGIPLPARRYGNRPAE